MMNAESEASIHHSSFITHHSSLITAYFPSAKRHMGTFGGSSAFA